MNEKISIVVPAYNCAEWIEQCLQSIIEQTYENIEIVLVDDGSTDKTPQICDAFATKDKRVIVIHKNNEGVSAARNTALEAVSGSYITFVDADDYLEKDVLKQAMAAVDDSTSVVIWNHSNVYSDRVERNKELFGSVPDPNRLRTAIISGYGRDFYAGNVRAPWGKLMRVLPIKEHALQFPVKLRYGEDAVFLINYLEYCEEIKLINYYGYYYRAVEVSASRGYIHNLLEQSIFERTEILRLYPGYGTSEEEKNAIYVFDWYRLHLLYRNSKFGYRDGLLEKENIKKDAKIWYETVLKNAVEKPGSYETKRRAMVMADRKLRGFAILLGPRWPFFLHLLLMKSNI